MRPSLSEHHYETVPEELPAAPSPGRGMVSPSLSAGTWRGCTPGAATAELHLPANCFRTGSQVCTALAGGWLGRAGRVLG